MASLREGLGFEELAPSGLTTSGTVVMNPHFTGSVTSEQGISGANVYATTLVQTTDVMASNDISGSTLKGTTISGTDMLCTLINDDDGRMRSVGVGSPTAFGGTIQAGSAALSAGSAVSVVFGTAFPRIPRVVCSYTAEPSSVGVVTGSNVSLTGFDAIGDTASKTFDWFAIGV